MSQSVGEHESESDKTSVLEAFCVCVCVGRGVSRGVRCDWGLGVDRGWLPLPTRLQRYFDPASLALCYFNSFEFIKKPI